jgi:hypothetical protein
VFVPGPKGVLVCGKDRLVYLGDGTTVKKVGDGHDIEGCRMSDSAVILNAYADDAKPFEAPNRLLRIDTTPPKAVVREGDRFDQDGKEYEIYEAYDRFSTPSNPDGTLAVSAVLFQQGGSAPVYALLVTKY